VPGVYLSNIKKNTIISRDNWQYDDYKIDQFTIMRSTLKRFLEDKIFYQDNEFVFIIEGVILNKIKLMEEFKKVNFSDLMKFLFYKYGEDFFKLFRGSFSGLYYNIKDKKWVVFTNHIGDKPIFYYNINNNLIVSSSVNWIIDTLNLNLLSYSLNQSAVYHLLTYGFMGDDNTLIHEINRLEAGHYITFQNGMFDINQYHCFSNEPNEEMTEEQIIESIDSKFKEAIKLEYEKDLEYGYKHIASLSGGLDSRMNNWVANSLGYNDILNITFSQSDYLDETIAKKIAKYLNHEFIFKYLDDAKFIENLDDITDLSFGLCSFAGIAHGLSLSQLINADNYGMLHSGQVGDIIIGSFRRNPEYTKVTKIRGQTSSILKDRISIDCDKYKNEEIYVLYNRGFKGALCSQIASENYIETISPFLDVDFLEFCFSIPLKFRCGHYIYKKWIIEKYPDAAKFKWEKTNSYITDSVTKIHLKKIYNKNIKKINHILINLKIKDNVPSKDNMNPFDYWYCYNNEIKNFMDSYYKVNIENSTIKDALKNDMKLLYTTGNTIEKCLVLSSLSAIKKYFNNHTNL
jgi:asparagine synthase (glutamine-hydrolysing)